MEDSRPMLDLAHLSELTPKSGMVVTESTPPLQSPKSADASTTGRMKLEDPVPVVGRHRPM